MVVTVHFTRLIPIFCRVSWDVQPSTYYASVAAAQLGGCRRAATSRRIHLRVSVTFACLTASMLLATQSGEVTVSFYFYIFFHRTSAPPRRFGPSRVGVRGAMKIHNHTSFTLCFLPVWESAVMLLLCCNLLPLAEGVEPLWWLGVSICLLAVSVASSYATHTPHKRQKEHPEV